MKKNAIFIPSSNRFAFALANVLMSIVDNSGGILADTDVLVLTDDMSERNRQVMEKIIPGIIFLPLYRNLPPEMLGLEHVKRGRYGIYIYQLLYGFEAVKRYEYVLQLETDIFVVSDISELFKLDCDIAWRNVLPWDPKKLLGGVLRHPEDKVFAPNGGVVLFRNSLNKFNIDKNSYFEAHQYLEPLYEKGLNGRGALNEQIVCYLCYMKEINVKLLDPSYNIVMGMDVSLPNEKIVHFSGSQKPWTDELRGGLIPQWFINYRKFLSYGGECQEEIHIPAFSRQDIYSAIEFGGLIINLMPDLDIIKKKYAQIQYTQRSRTVKFFINGWPKCIHYEITLHLVNVTVELHVEEPFKSNSSIIEMLKTLESSLKRLFSRYRLVKESGCESLVAYCNKNDISTIGFLLNALFAITYPEINSFLRRSGTDMTGGAMS